MASVPAALQSSLVALTRALVAIDSRGDLADQSAVFAAVSDWLTARGVVVRVLRDRGRAVALCGEVMGRRGAQARHILLNATVDTAAFGDLDAWSAPPLSGRVHRGWLYGRGSADSKSGVAVFCHVLAVIAAEAGRHGDSLAFVFDVDEHAGGFGGIRRWYATIGRHMHVAGAMIAYPGEDRIVIGCRGFQRATLTVHGLAAHSGSSRRRGVNAIARASTLVEALHTAQLPAPVPGAFPLPAQVTVTRVAGGESFSTVPDRCEVDVDIRLTPTFAAAQARRLLRRVVAALDADGLAPPTSIRDLPGWPAYRLDDDAPVYASLRAASREVLGRDVPAAIVGPSSVANFLAAKGIPATSGFGVHYRNLHACDERIEVATLEPTYHTYLTAVRALLS